MTKYADRLADFADAGLVALADRWVRLVTIDNDFTIYRAGLGSTREAVIARRTRLGSYSGFSLALIDWLL